LYCPFHSFSTYGELHLLTYLVFVLYNEFSHIGKYNKNTRRGREMKRKEWKAFGKQWKDIGEP
jgi:hypothetical protein